MSVELTQDRLKRLVDSGLRGTCRPSERLLQLKRKAEGVDHLEIKRLEQLFFGLSDKTRLMILQLLADEELCSCEITAALNLTEPTTSHHLGILERSGLVASRRDGKWVFYRLARHDAKTLLTKGAAIVKGAT
ncbi:MAG: metalloregulator ArsR/SmtB family transcription factor [Candidatus Bathyarchaeia archaeon]